MRTVRPRPALPGSYLLLLGHYLVERDRERPLEPFVELLDEV
jgi:hypothetical protein